MNDKKTISHQETLKMHLFLKELRSAGICNQYQSPLKLSREFGLSLEEAKQIFSSWSASFKGDGTEINLLKP
jgi:hypothetical protein